MASANLQFKIGSTFSGEGFKQAQKAVGNVKQSVQPALTATNSLASAFTQLSTSSNKAAAAIGALLGAFAQGGAKAAAFVLAQTAINLAVNKFFESATNAAEAAKRMSDALASEAHGAFTDAMAAKMKSITTEVTTLRTQFDTLTLQANAFRDAMNGLQSSRAEGGVIALQIEKFNAMLEADSDAMKKDIEATYNLKIAKEQAKKVEEDYAAKVQTAMDTRVQSENRISVINDQLKKLAASRAELEEELKTLQESDLISRRDAKKKLDELTAKQQSLESDLQAEMEKKKVALVKEQTAIQDAANANDKMKLAVEEAAAKIEETGTKWGACDPAAFVGNYEQGKEQELQEKFKDLIREMPQKLSDLKQANADVANAVANFKNAQEAYNRNFVTNEVANLINNGINGANGALLGLRGDVLKNQGKIAGEAGKIAGQAALEAGQVKTVAELKKVENEAARQARIQLNSKQVRQQELEASRYKRLSEQSDKALSQVDKQWKADYEKVHKAAEAQAKAVADAKKAVEDAKERQKKVQEDINTIATQLKDMNIDGVEEELGNIKTSLEGCLKLG